MSHKHSHAWFFILLLWVWVLLTSWIVLPRLDGRLTALETIFARHLNDHAGPTTVTLVVYAPERYVAQPIEPEQIAERSDKFWEEGE